MRRASTNRRTLNIFFYSLVITLFIFSNGGVYAAEATDGYRGARWGMGVEEVRGVIQELGLKYIDHKNFRVSDTMFGSDAEIRYLVGDNLPLESVMVEIRKPPKAPVPYEKIRAALVQKYGKPLKKRAGHEKDRLEMWTTPKTSIWLMVDDDAKFTLIIYTDLDAERKYY
ncbi:MAG: hypothetical protein ACE5D4_06820 [Thermodesulfobacteriota bacterium]